MQQSRDSTKTQMGSNRELLTKLQNFHTCFLAVLINWNTSIFQIEYVHGDLIDTITLSDPRSLKICDQFVCLK